MTLNKLFVLLCIFEEAAQRISLRCSKETSLSRNWYLYFVVYYIVGPLSMKGMSQWAQNHFQGA